MNQMDIIQMAVYENTICFGRYNTRDPLCTKHCVLRLRCAIEQDQNLRTEMIEDIIGFDSEIKNQ